MANRGSHGRWRVSGAGLVKILQHKASRLSGNSLAQYVLFLSRVLHSAVVGLPVALLLCQTGTDAYYAFYIGLCFAVIALLVFQVLGIYSDSFFTNKYRFKKTLLAWSAAFFGPNYPYAGAWPGARVGCGTLCCLVRFHFDTSGWFAFVDLAYVSKAYACRCLLTPLGNLGLHFEWL